MKWVVHSLIFKKYFQIHLTLLLHLYLVSYLIRKSQRRKPCSLVMANEGNQFPFPCLRMHFRQNLSVFGSGAAGIEDTSSVGAKTARDGTMCTLGIHPDGRRLRFLHAYFERHDDLRHDISGHEGVLLDRLGNIAHKTFANGLRYDIHKSLS